MQDLKSLVAKADKEVERWTKIGQSARELMAVVPGLMGENVSTKPKRGTRVWGTLKPNVARVLRTATAPMTTGQIAHRIGASKKRVAAALYNNKAMFARVAPSTWAMKS